jgi:hypothetical protein
VHKRPGAAPKGFLWFTLFDAVEGVRASKVEVSDPGNGAGHYLHMGTARFEPGRVVGAAPSEKLDAAWELEFESSEPPLRHLPRRWMYSGPVPRTKVLTPHPGVTFRGRLRAGERTISVEGWPGMIGHNWGSEHAERAIWIHGANFDGRERDWLDLVLGRVRLGPLTTPWIANGAVAMDGARHRLGGALRARALRIDETPERCRFRVTGDDVKIDGTVGAGRDRFVSWIYAQPDGRERQTTNCSIADMHLEVSRAGAPPITLWVTGGAAYELQMAERYPEIPPQPFPDG